MAKKPLFPKRQARTPSGTERTIGWILIVLLAIAVGTFAWTGTWPGPPGLPCARGQDQGPEQAVETAPPPYSADQIREATAVGRRYVFRFEIPGQPTQLHTIEFVEVSAHGFV